MPYITTTLNDNTTYTLETQLVAGQAAVTVVSIKTTGTMTAEVLVHPNGSRSIGNGLARIIFIVNAPAGASGTFKVLQSGVTLANLTIGGTAPVDIQATFEVV